MKAIPVFLCTACMLTSAHAANIYSTTENSDGGRGSIYSTHGNRGIYTTEDSREGRYVTRGDGGIYSTADKREGIYTSRDEPAPPTPHNGPEGMAGSVYNGYMPGD